MSDAELASLRELAAKATKAPWKMGLSLDARAGRWPVMRLLEMHVGDEAEGRANIALIVALRNSLDALLARIEAGERLAEAAQKVDGLAQYQDSRTFGPAVRRDLMDDLHKALAAYAAAKEGI